VVACGPAWSVESLGQLQLLLPPRCTLVLAADAHAAAALMLAAGGRVAESRHTVSMHIRSDRAAACRSRVQLASALCAADPTLRPSGVSMLLDTRASLSSLARPAGAT